MKKLTITEYVKLKSFTCDKGKHRFRSNHFGVSWCTICGALSNKDFPLAEEHEKLQITND